MSKTNLPLKYDPALLDRLTARERAFIQHPEVLVNATKAAVEAGYSEGWARGNAGTKRKQLMYFILPEVHKRWAEKGVTLERIHEELAAIAFANMADYYDRVELDDGTQAMVGKDPTLLPEVMSRAIEQVTIENLMATDGTITQRIGFVLHDKKPALKMLAELLGGFDPRTREPQDAATRRKQAELFDFMKPDEIDTIVKIYQRAEKRQKAAAVDAEIVPTEKT